MRISKSQSIILASGLTLILFIAILLSNSGGQKRTNTAEVADSDITENQPPSSAFSLKDFHRAETKNGKPLWEVSAASGQYSPESGSTRLKTAKLLFYRDSDSPVELQAGTALVSFEGASLSRASASEGVVISYDRQIVLNTEAADYDKNSGIVSAAGSVRIESDTMSITGEGMTADLSGKRIKLARNVKTLIKPDKKGRAK